VKTLKPSEFMLLCAECHDAGIEIPPELRSRAPDGWHDYLSLTLPEPFAPAFADGTLESMRPMRFMLAAAIAQSEGR
jgi:hypothetical protein